MSTMLYSTTSTPEPEEIMDFAGSLANRLFNVEVEVTIRKKNRDVWSKTFGIKPNKENVVCEWDVFK